MWQYMKPVICFCIFCRLLLVGGCETDEDGVSKATACGISAWRVLSGSPHYKQVTSYEDDIKTVSIFSLFNFLEGMIIVINRVI